MNPRIQFACLAFFVALLALLPSTQAQPARSLQGREKSVQEPLADQVRRAIDRGVQFLRDQENGRGDWEIDALSASKPGGWTALALLALLNSGVKPDDPIIERGLKFLRGIQPQYTYVVGLQTMAYAAAGKDIDKERIQINVDWLVKARVMNGPELEGWGYSPRETVGGADNSNTQYALLGLHDGHVAGAKIDRAVWQSIQNFYVNTQLPSGAWDYKRNMAAGRLTMTTAGLCGLYIAGLELNEGREILQKDGTATNCGQYNENKSIQAAHSWISPRLRLDQPQAIYYNLYGIERTGRLSGQRFLGNHDWYREGCQYLVQAQNKEDGSWSHRGAHDAWPVVSTSFALLFLSKGRTPILISKLVHGPGNDWNNDRYDVRHLVDYASKEMFKRQPLGWQIFDAKRAKVENENDLLELTGELLQSPIAYFNGHEVPRFNDTEERLLKEYVDQGGFIFAEACCGRPAFDQGFRALMKRLFPDNDLQPLAADHPLWRAHALVPPGSFKLEGIQQGCKTVVVYSPEDLSCLWEANQSKADRGQLAFRLGGNIVAYATGMEMPKPRLTEVEVLNHKDDQKKIPRGYLKVAQIRHEGDWQPAPHAMRNLMAHLRDKPRLQVALQTEPLRLSHPDLPDFKFLYMHGRNAFNFADDEIVNLRADLQTGGLLLADACCGKKAFDTAFRVFAEKLFPDKKLEPIPLADELFSKELNGEAINSVRCRREKADGAGPEPEFHEAPPYLEGIKHNGRWVVIYSKYDLGCALEKHQSSDCLGHDFPSAIKLGSAAVLYAFKR